MSKATEQTPRLKKNSEEQKLDQGASHQDNNTENNISTSKLLQKSHEILRKQTKRAGQILKKSLEKYTFKIYLTSTNYLNILSLL